MPVLHLAGHVITAPRCGGDVYTDNWIGSGVFATYGPSVDTTGLLTVAEPFDGCSKMAPFDVGLKPYVLVAMLLPNSTCTPMEQALYGEQAGAAAVINVAEGVGEGYI